MNHPAGKIPAVAQRLFLVLSAACMAVSCKQSANPTDVSSEKWHVYTQANSPIANNRINGMAVVIGGTIWFATQDGASSFARGNWATMKDSLTYYNALNLPARIVTSICEGKDRSLWFGLRGGGIMRYSPNSDVAVWRRYKDEIADNAVFSIAADNSNQSIYGEMWLTTAFGISRFITASDQTGGGSWLRPYTRSNTPELPSNQIPSAITKLDDNSIWFGTQSGGPVSIVYGLSGLEWQNYTLPAGSDSRINSIGWDLNNTVWFGTDKGVASYNLRGGNWNVYTFASTHGKLPQAPVNAVVTNLLNTRWFGTDSGLVRLTDTTWTRFTPGNSPLPSDTVTALVIDHRQNLWIGTPNGAAVYNENGISY